MDEMCPQNLHIGDQFYLFLSLIAQVFADEFPDLVVQVNLTVLLALL